MQRIWQIGPALMLAAACSTEVGVRVDHRGSTMDPGQFEVWLTDGMTCAEVQDSGDVAAVLDRLEPAPANARVEAGQGVVVAVVEGCDVFYGCTVWEDGMDNVLVVVNETPITRCDDRCPCSDGGLDMSPADLGPDTLEDGGVDSGADAPDAPPTECDLALEVPTQAIHPDRPLPTCTSPDMIAVTTGFQHACALSDTGVAYCWGSNRWGAVDPTHSSTSNLSPTRVTWTGDSPIRQIAAGHEHTCAVTNEGVHCWGNDGGAQNRLGGGDTGVNNHGPVLIPGCFGEISVGLYHACGVRSGQVWCWGQNVGGELGRVGAGATDQVAGPTTERLMRQHVVAGVGNSCAWNDDDAASLRCWGYNRNFAVGFPTGAVIPVRRLEIGTGAPIVMGSTHTEFVDPPAGSSEAACAGLPGDFLGNTCAITDEADGAHLYCWGSNPCGGAGSGNTNHVRGPAEPFRLNGVPLDGTDWKLAVGGGTSCLLRRDPPLVISELVCWGDGSHGQLEGVEQRLAPTSDRLLFSHDVVDVDVGGAFVCAISEWRVHCWGYNSHGQVRPGTESASTPQCVAIP